MPTRELVHAWLALLLLSYGTVLIASNGTQGSAWMAGGVLVLAGLKARVILARYLGLSASRFWMRVFDLVIGIFLAAAYALYLFGSGR
ncbi:nitric oxide reductase F protein [Hyphomicrobium nitrativorans NL23]|uniref:Nitric oxide reductase F protein n=1 Tax=Hyphomicrobium nitrativorans NL23 TaxID=1029756 RepID=V5SCP2_9HYPH|nr:hypothetical protein [Hyphomicrobium nitrativorans]AHB48257.1 nitric oxide reductase F protein [Hyphomicrobium nitrativorans NL23]